jgi:hypothetical protein
MASKSGERERPLALLPGTCTCTINCQYNNIKNENTNDGVEGYQWLFAVTKMLNNITLLIAKRGQIAWTRFP